MLSAMSISHSIPSPERHLGKVFERLYRQTSGKILPLRNEKPKKISPVLKFFDKLIKKAKN